MTEKRPSLMPHVGFTIQAFFGGNSYRAKVVAHGKKYPVIRFTLKNGRVVEGPATVLPHDEPLGASAYYGYLAKMLHPSCYER